MVGALIAISLGGNLPLFSFQNKITDRPYGRGAGVWGSLNYYQGAECKEREAKGVACYHYSSYGAPEANSGIPGPENTTAMQASDGCV